MRSLPRLLTFRLLLIAAMAVMPSLAAWAQDDAADPEELAIKAAVLEAAPSVVQIQTIGGLERVGKVLIGTGPTSGLVVSEDGYIISSAFNFAQKPTSILVGLPDGTRTPAKLVATDHSRMLVLLKVEVDEKLTPPTVAPEKEMQVGQWSLALGRTFEGDRPNVSVGIVSALNRIFGKAVQTDAKVSPANYGGPLIDIQGRVMGVLVPLSPRGTGKVAGVEWYDSGIGFAIPLDHIMTVVPKLMKGKDLHPGIIGVNLRAGHQFANPAVIAAARPNSPAAEAGFKTGDKIVEIDGVKIIRQSQVKEALGHRYAGETVHIAVIRGKERIERDLKLVDKVQAYERPFLGVLPLRVAAAPSSEKEDGDKKDAPAENGGEAGVVVRYVYRESGADVAGIEPGDRIVSVDGRPVADREALREAIGALQRGEKTKIGIRRGDNDRSFEVALGAQPEAVPKTLPSAMASRKPFIGEQPPLGKQPVKIAEFENTCFTYVPEAYDPAVAHGMLVWLHEPGGLKDDAAVDKLIARWKPHCEEHNLILVVPRSQSPTRWVPAKEIAFVAKVIEHVQGIYHVDATRVVTHGYQAGGAMAYAVAFGKRELVRGVAAIDSPIGGRPPENDPVHSLAFYATTAKKGRAKPATVAALVKRLRGLKYPVTVVDQGETARHLNGDELGELLRWIDTLDRI